MTMQELILPSMYYEDDADVQTESIGGTNNFCVVCGKDCYSLVMNTCCDCRGNDKDQLCYPCIRKRSVNV